MRPLGLHGVFVVKRHVIISSLCPQELPNASLDDANVSTQGESPEEVVPVFPQDQRFLGFQLHPFSPAGLLTCHQTRATPVPSRTSCGSVQKTTDTAIMGDAASRAVMSLLGTQRAGKHKRPPSRWRGRSSSLSLCVPVTTTSLQAHITSCGSPRTGSAGVLEMTLC